MHHRPVLTPKERRPINLSVERVIEGLDSARKRMNAELQLVFEKLPITIVGNYPYPDVVIEKSRRYIDSIALVTRERKKFLWLFPYTREERVDLCVHRLTDFAHELAFFESEVVAGDAFERESDSGVTHGELIIRCNCGEYELQASVYEVGTWNNTAISSVQMGLFPFRDLVAVLLRFGLPERGWRERNGIVSN